jgi:autotransporter-associated beta strand repeat
MKTSPIKSHSVLLNSLLMAGALGLAQVVVAQTTTWTGNALDLNWSTAGNWSTVGGSTPPGPTDIVVFGAGPYPASTNGPGSVDAVITANTTIGGLQYINTTASGSFHTTQINAGQTLTVNGLFAAGVAGQTTVVAITGAGNFSVNNITGNFNVGGGGISTAIVTVGLPDGTNTINAKTLSLAESGSNNGRTCILNLGAGPTVINADNVNLGTGKGQSAIIQWLDPTFTNSITFRNTATTGRATFLMGNGFSASGAPFGQLLLTGHRADILASTVTMGRASGSSTANSRATITYDNGIIDATSIIMGDIGTANAFPNISAQVNPATLNAGGNETNVATLLVNSPGGPGGGRFIIGGSVTNHIVNVAVNIFTNGIANVYCPMVKADSAFQSFNNTTLNVSGGTLNMQAATNTIGTRVNPIDTVTLDFATLVFAEDGSSLNLAANSLTLNDTNFVNIVSLPPIVHLPTIIPIMSYVTLNSPVNLGVGSLPGDYHGHFADDGAGSINLVIDSGTVVVAKQDIWLGAVNSNWDVSSLNWTNAGLSVTNYSEADFVTFDDRANTGNVTLLGNQHAPSSVTVSNNSLNYVFSGAGKISGATSLVKIGSASLTIAETGGDNFAGGIVVHGGTLVLDNPNSVIAGGLTNDPGATVQLGNNDGNGVLPSGFLQVNGSLVFNQTSDRILSAIVSGSGSLTQNGSSTLTLTSAQAYTGNTIVSKGTLALSGVGSVSSPLTRIQNATLDVRSANSPTFTQLTLTNGVLNIGAGTNLPNAGISAISNSTIVLIADYNNIVGSPILATTSLTTGGTTNTLAVTAINNLPLSPPIPFQIPLIGYGSATFNGGLNIGWTNLPGISGFISNNAVNKSIDLVITSAPQNITWNGGSATVNNWSDAANWNGVALTPLDALTFDGAARINNTNDTAAGTTYVGVTFNPGASPFTLNGAPIRLTGTMVNSAPDVQTINLGLVVSAPCTLDGGLSGGTLAFNGGVTNTSASAQTVSLSGVGTMNDKWATTGGRLQFELSGDGSAWTILDGTGSGALVQAGSAQLHVNPTGTGEIDFGTTLSAPNLDLGSTTNGNLAIDGTTAGTFNMNSGALKVNSVTAGGNGTQHSFINVNGGTLIMATGGFTAGSGAGASTLAITITNGSVFNTNGGPFTLTQRSAASITQSGGLLRVGGLVLTTGQTIGANGIYNLNGGTLVCSNISIGSAGNNAWATINYNGGTLSPGTNTAGLFTVLNFALLTNEVQAGGAIIDTAGFNTTFNQPLITDPALGGSPDGGLTKLGAGTLTLSAANTYNGNTAVNAGTLFVSGSLATGDVIVAANGTLAGTGAVGGQVAVNGTVAPGTTAATGKLTVLSNATISAAGTNVMKLNKGAATNDVLSVSGTLTYGGTLNLTNLSGTLAANDSFKLFNAGSYSGSFARLLPATPATGLTWNTNTLAIDGILRIATGVNTSRTNITFSLSGNQLNLSWPADHIGWRLQAQTNAPGTGLTTNWATVPGSTTVNSMSFTINPANSSVFFRMVYP